MFTVHEEMNLSNFFPSYWLLTVVDSAIPLNLECLYLLSLEQSLSYSYKTLRVWSSWHKNATPSDRIKMILPPRHACQLSCVQNKVEASEALKKTQRLNTFWNWGKVENDCQNKITTETGEAISTHTNLTVTAAHFLY